MGFEKSTLEYVSAKRFGGGSKYTFKKLFNLSVNALTSFSNAPLRIGILAGGVTGLFAVAIAVYSLIMWLRTGAPSGYTTIVILVSLLFSMNFFVIGVIGEYIGHILIETKKRPLYIIDKKINFSE
jgi:dolichol-phosphate mannosyltransferase